MSIILLATMLCSVSNPDYNSTKSQARGAAICNRNVSSATKAYIYDEAGIINHNGYCINHIIPLAIGGSNHLDNLEPMKFASNGLCSSGGENEAITCFLNKSCSQEEAIGIVLSDIGY